MYYHNDDTIKTNNTVLLEKYTSHFIWKGCVWEGVGDRTELQHIDPHSIGINSVSFPFSWAAQPGAWGPILLGVGFLYRILSPTGWISFAPSYIIVQRPPSSCGRHKSHSFNSSTFKVIFWYSSTRCTCYVHRCISYFDSPAGSEVNIQQLDLSLFEKYVFCIINQKNFLKLNNNFQKKKKKNYNRT